MACCLAVLQLAATAAPSDYWHTFYDQGQKQLLSKSYTGAEVSFRQALREVKRSAHTNDELVLCMVSLADILQLENVKEESWSLYRKALKVLERTYGKDSAKLFPLLITMGSVTEIEGEYKNAAVFYARAAVIAEAKTGAGSLELATALHKSGHAEFHQGLAKDAEDHYRKALTILMAQNTLPSREPVLELLSDYLDLMHKYTGPSKILTSKFEQELLKDEVQLLGRTRAVPQSAWQQAMQNRLTASGDVQMVSAGSLNLERIVPPDNSSRASNFETFATAAQLLAALSPSAASPEKVEAGSLQRGQGIDYYERMVAIDTKTLGPNHPSVARDLKGLAAIYVSQHRYAEARPLLERAVSIYQSVYSADDLSIKHLKILLRLINDEPDTRGGASPFVADAAKIPLQAQTFEVAQRLNELAFMSYCQGKLDDARAAYAWALASTDDATGSKSVFVAACLQDYLQVMRSSGKAEEADKMQALAKSILADALSAQLLNTYK